MKTKTDKEIDKIVKKCIFFFKEDVLRENDDAYTIFLHKNLCSVFYESKYHYLWDMFWSCVNTKDKTFANSYFDSEDYLYSSIYPDSSTDEIRAFLRLLLVEEFKQWINNEREFK